MKKAQEHIEDLIDQYDDQLSDLLKERMNELHGEIHEKRKNGHPDVQAILDEAHTIEAKANRASEIHITERHLGNPVFFYPVGDELNNMSSAIKFGDKKMKFHGLSPEYEKGDYRLHVLRAGDYGNYELFSFKERTFLKSGNNWIKHTPVFLHDLKFFGGERYFLTKEGVLKLAYPWNDKLNQAYVSKVKIQKLNNVVPRLTIDLKGDRAFYLHYDKDRAWIRKVNMKKPNEAHASIIDTTNQLKKPVDLCFDNSSQRLLVQDFDSKKIFSLETLKERNYPYFKDLNDYIEIPAATWRSGKDFTLSFWAKSSGIKNSKKIHDELDDVIFHISHGPDDRFRLAYSKNGVTDISGPKTINTKAAKAALASKEWYHFIAVKSGDKLKCYINDYTVLEETVPVEIDTYLRDPNLKFKFSFPGHFVTELRLWNKAKNVKEIQTDRIRWLDNRTENLSGNWRLDDTLIIDTNQHEKLEKTKLGDYSGNGRHAVKFTGNWKKVSPPQWSQVIPIYSFSVMSQNLAIDLNTSMIYWVDQYKKDGWYYVMGGSTMGHTNRVEAHVLATSFPDPGLTVLSAENKPFEKLIIAHAKRRNAFRTILEKGSHSMEKAHQTVSNTHQEIAEEKRTLMDVDNNPYSKDTASEVNKAWGARIEEMHKTEKEQQRKVARNRLKALEEVRLKANELHQEMAKSRRNHGLDQLNLKKEE